MGNDLSRSSNGRFLLVGRLLVGVFSAISLVLTARYVGSQVFAEFGVLLVALNILIDIVDFGANSMSSKQVAAKQISKKQFFCRMKVKSLLVFFVVVCLSPLALLLDLSLVQMLFLPTYAALWIQVNYIQEFLLAEERYFHSILFALFERFIWLSILFFAYFQVNKEISFALPLLMGLICHVVLGYKYLKIPASSIPELIATLKKHCDSFNYATGSIGTDVATLDSNLVVLATDAATGGSYVLGQRFKNQVILGYVVFATRIRNSVADKDEARFVAVTKSESYLVLLNTFGIFMLIPISYLFAEDVFGQSYSNVNTVLSLVLLNGIFNGVSHILFDVLNFAGFARTLSRHFVPLIPLQLIVVFVIAKTYGLVATTLGLLATTILMTLQLARLTRKSLQNHFKS